MKRLGILLVLVFALGGVQVAAQDKYPSKPVKVVVPFGPGSATDIVMRIVGEHMRPILGQPVVIENKPGAFGILAIEEMARSRPDGYTLQIGNPGTNVLAPIIYKKKFKIDYDKDVTLVTRLSEVPHIALRQRTTSNTHFILLCPSLIADHTYNNNLDYYSVYKIH